MKAVNSRVSVTMKSALNKLDRKTVEGLVNTAMVAGGQLVRNEWIQGAPYRTGTYKRSIHVYGHGDAELEGEEMPAPADPLQVEVGTNITKPPYPVYLEYGTSRMAPRPSAGPALDATEDEVLQEVADVFAELLAREVRL